MAEQGEATIDELPALKLEQEVKITVEVSCRRQGLNGDHEEALNNIVTDNGETHEETNPPTLEELDCKFLLSIFGGITDDGDESPQISFKNVGDDGTQGDDLLESWSHTFTSTMTVNRETVIRMCRSPDSSIALRKAELDSPLILLPIDLAPLVAGDQTIELGASLANTELIQKPYYISEFNVKICISGRFLTSDLEAALMPMCITIVAAEDLPDFPKYQKLGTWSAGANPRTLSLLELREQCLPAYCSYCFMPSSKSDEQSGNLGETEQEDFASDWSKPVRTHGMPQSKTIRFKHKKVFLAGLIHPSDLISHLKTTPLEIELHDRDTFYPPKLEADDEDESSKIPPTWSGLKTIDASRAAEALPQNPCGVCHINLMPLCDGRKVFVERCNLWPKKIKYPDFSAHQKPTTGDYVNAGSVLVVKVELCQPLKTAREEVGPFRRVVMCIRYSNSDALLRLNNSIIKINAEFLGNLKSKPVMKAIEGDDLPSNEAAEGEIQEQAKMQVSSSEFRHDALHSMLQEGVGIDKLEKGLSTIELTHEECHDPSLDIISGVQIMDNVNRIFILEGLSGGISRLLDENPRAARNSKDYKMLYHPDITFAHRLYGSYHVVVKKIKLRENLRQLIANVTTYLEPKYVLTAWALIRLQEIVRAGRMRTLRDLILFPAVEQLNHMEKKVGDALSIEDITGKKYETTRVDKSNEEDIPRLSTEELAKAVLMPRPKHKAPTDCENPVYLQYLAARPKKDYVQEYIDSKPRPKRMAKEETDADFGEVYNYGGQSLQYTSLQMDFRQKKYGSDYGKIHWTYSKDLLSGALVLVDPQQQERAEKRRSKEMWLTKEGFQWPKVSMPKEMKTLEKKQSQLGKMLTDYRVDEMKDAWIENQWNPIGKSYEKPDLPPGQRDFNIRYNTASKPFEQNPIALRSVFAVESGAALEAQQRKQETHQSWSKALVVESKNFQVLWSSGRGQIDRLRPLLKSKPTTLALKTLPHVEGCQPGVENPPSIFTKDQYLDPLRSYVVQTYGASLRVEPAALDDPSRKVMKWNNVLATGVVKPEALVTPHTRAFTASGTKPKNLLRQKELLHIRSVKPLGLGPEDRPSKLYPHTYQRQVAEN